MGFLSELFGYLLNALYNVFNNYGIAIIIFSIVLRIILIPITIKQQKSMKKSAEIQEEMKEISKKYKNNPEKLNQETIDLYKREKMSPFSGCLSSIVQLLIILAVFWLVSQPLTYMKRLNKVNYDENTDKSVVDYYKDKLKEENENQKTNYSEIAIIEKYGNSDERVSLNMDFLGLDLSKVPSNNLSDWRVYIIPLLYVVSSVISIKLTTNMANKKEENKKVVDGENYSPKLESLIHKTIKKVQTDLTTMAYNTAVSSLMILANSYDDQENITKADYKLLLTLLNPIAPHVTEELNEELGFKPICESAWPVYDETKTIDNEIELPVQFNGKLKATVTVPMNADEEIVKDIVHKNETICGLLEGKTIVKEIYVKNKIYNIVIR